jgi:hypothetical protein
MTIKTMHHTRFSEGEIEGCSERIEVGHRDQLGAIRERYELVLNMLIYRYFSCQGESTRFILISLVATIWLEQRPGAELTLSGTLVPSGWRSVALRRCMCHTGAVRGHLTTVLVLA